jgi:hypothetical protein
LNECNAVKQGQAAAADRYPYGILRDFSTRRMWF